MALTVAVPHRGGDKPLPAHPCVLPGAPGLAFSAEAACSLLGGKRDLY